MGKEQRKRSKKKQVGLFILKVLIYFAVLLALVYLYGYSGLTSMRFIYNEF